MEEEARTLLRAALQDEVTPRSNLAEAIRARFRRLGGVELRLPARGPIREPPKLDGSRSHARHFGETGKSFHDF